MIKLIISDLDGTIVSNDNRIRERTLQVIQKLKNHDILFVVCTGRSKEDMQSCIQSGYKIPTILMNGSFMLDENKEVLVKYPMKKEDIEMVKEILLKRNFPIILYGESKTYFQGNVELIEKCHQIYFSEEEAMFFGEIIPLKDEDDPKEEIFKMETMSPVDEDKEACLQELLEKNQFSIATSMPYNIEITQQGVHKEKMIRHLLEIYSVNEDEMLYFGDSLNDLQVFENFKNCIAVENAVEIVKKKAQMVIGPCELESVADYIDKYILHNEGENSGKKT